MTDLRDSTSWIIASILAAIAIAIGWLVQSGIIVALISVLIGAGISYFVTTRTQRRTWKREYAIKAVEEVYGALFKDVRIIIQQLERKEYIYSNIAFSSWANFQLDHHYFMVDQNFRARLDAFLERIGKYSQAATKLSKNIREILIEETVRFFKIKTDQIPMLQIKYTVGYSQTASSPDLMRCLATQTHPIEFVKTIEPKASNVSVDLLVTSIAKRITESVSNTKEFEKFWQSCLQKTKDDETYKSQVEENTKITEEAKKLRDEIVKRIESPWKI
jgi:hypothetical protein